MRRALGAIFVLGTISVISLSFETSCKHIGPIERCRGGSVNRRFVPETTTPEDVCTECIEATCCDLIGDCQDNECANEVAATHACVQDAGRSAAITEPECRDSLRGDQSKKVYQCMRDNCDDECLLPTCRLDPLVPPLGDLECDRCFAQSCCNLMNQCAQNRTCLLAIRCIVEECSAEFGDELSISQAKPAEARREILCDGGGPPPDADLDDGDLRGPGCFGRCIQKTFVDNDPQSSEARCLAAQINECGAAVDCGRFCRVRSDAGPPPADAGADAPSD
jgi:hypothetical protein